MGKTTCIRDIDWMVAWDSDTETHRFLRDAYLLYEDDTIVDVGSGRAPGADVIESATGRLIIPGLVDLHAHPDGELAFRGIREDHGVPSMYMTGLYERLQAFSLSEQGRLASSEATYAELIKSGVTTVVDISSCYAGWLPLAQRSGMRVYLAPSFASARHKMTEAFRLEYDWADDDGRASYDSACALMDDVEQVANPKLRAVVSPSTMDDVSAVLLKESFALACDKKRPYTVHASESVLEVRNMIERCGDTPIQYASKLGILGARTILGHALFLDRHSWIDWHTDTDLTLISNTKTNVAHCPTPFSRYGTVMEDFGKYRRAGINMGIGTDTLPANMIDEIRTATVLGRVASRHVHGTTMAAAFHAATAGGARALGRDDLGKLAPGAKADWVSVDLSHPYMRPVRDPLRSLIFSAGDRAVRDVVVGGQKLLAGGELLTVDHKSALASLEAAQEQMIDAVPVHDYLGRMAEQITPMSFPVMGGRSNQT
jgi:5-methylthioadenosine/S-adenosylhomocysteine deaminase